MTTPAIRSYQDTLLELYRNGGRHNTKDLTEGSTSTSTSNILPIVHGNGSPFRAPKRIQNHHHNHHHPNDSGSSSDQSSSTHPSTIQQHTRKKNSPEASSSDSNTNNRGKNHNIHIWTEHKKVPTASTATNLQQHHHLHPPNIQRNLVVDIISFQ